MHDRSFLISFAEASPFDSESSPPGQIDQSDSETEVSSSCANNGSQSRAVAPDLDMDGDGEDRKEAKWFASIYSSKTKGPAEGSDANIDLSAANQNL